MQRKRLGIALVVVLVIIIAAMGYLFYFAAPQAESSATSTEESSSIVSHLNSEDDLTLQLTLNTTRLNTGQTVQIQVEDSNVVDSTNYVTAADDWAGSNLGQGFGPCTFVYEPVRYSVFEGNYSISNFTEGEPLQLVNPQLTYHCPAEVTANSYAFEPSSAVANVSACSGNPCNSIHFLVNVTLIDWASYVWPASATSNQPMEPSVYTVVAGDEWGNVILAYFRVQPH